MKRIILLIAAIAVTSGAFAQFSWGIKGGLNLASISNSKTPFTNDYEDIKGGMRPSFYVGAFAEYQLNNWIGIQAEVFYSGQGTKYHTDTSSNEGDNEYNAHRKSTYGLRLNYINVPVVAKIYVIEGLSIEVGPQFGFMVSHPKAIMSEQKKFTIDGIEQTISIKRSAVAKNAFKKFDIALAMGASYKLTKSIDVTARYTLGFIELNKETVFNEIKSLKNGVIQVGVGYHF